MARSYSGPNWGLLSKVCGAVFVVALAAVFYPTVLCIGGAADDVALPSGGFDGSTIDNSSVQTEAIDATQDMARSFGSRIGACYAADPLPSRPMPYQVAGLIGLVGFVLFRVLGQIDYKRQVRRASRRQRTARQSIVKERTSRNTTGGGHPAVGSTGGTARLTSSNLPATPGRATGRHSAGLTPRELTSGSRALASLDDLAPLRDETDVLAQLDAEIERRSTTSNPRVPSGSDIVAPEDELPDLGDFGWDDDDEGWGAAPAAPMGSATMEASADALADALGLDGAHTPGETLSPGDAGLAAALAGGFDDSPHVPASSGAATSGARGTQRSAAAPPKELVLSRIAVPRAATVNGDLVIQVLAEGLDHFLDALDITLAIIDADGVLTPAVQDAEPETIGSFHTLPGGGEIVIPWTAFSVATLEVARGVTGCAAGVRVVVRSPRQEMTVDAPLSDAVHLRVMDQYQSPWEHLLFEAIDGLGNIRYARPSSARGDVRIDGLAPGGVQLRRVDYGDLQATAGEPTTRLELATSGVAFALPSGSMRDDPHHDLIAWRANRLYVQPGTPDGDGTAERPYATVQEAIASIARHRAPDSPNLDEIRVFSAETRPAKRTGLRHYADGRCEWLEWWRGERADTSRAWLRAVDADEVRRKVEQIGPGALASDGLFENVGRVRVVGASYAAYFDELNEGRREAPEVAERALADIPLNVLTRPKEELASPFRLAFHDVHRVTLVGVHLLGGKGQSGVEIRNCAQVDLVRCWVEGFASGMTKQRGVVAVGRGLQVDNSGQFDDTTRVRIERCDIGFNEARRRSMPIRGAGIAVYSSRVEIANCYIHDNHSTQAPTDVVVDRQSDVRGSRNHRERNEVA